MVKPISFELESSDWLRNIRWAEIVSLALAVVAAGRFGFHPPLWVFALVFSGLAAWNFFLPQLEDRFFDGQKVFLFSQILVDVATLTLVLWWTGGLVNPLAGFYVLHVLLAGLFLDSVFTVAVAGISLLCVFILVYAPTPPLPYWFGLPVELTLLIGLTTAFILLFLHRLGLANEELRRTVKMDALGRLVTGLSHEIGTPLNSILLLSKELGETAEGETKRNLSLVEGQARRCGEIVSLLLGYSNTLVRQSDDIQFQPVEVIPWVEGIYRRVFAAEAKRTPLLVPAQIAFEISAPSAPESLLVPELVMRQVLENLFKNAIYALRKTPRAKITVQIYPDLVEEEYVFSVEDNGSGFTPEGRERAFEAFFTTKTEELAPGLGLYISYYLLGHVCGRIAIAEASGAGAIMQVRLPRLEALDYQAAMA